MLWFKCDSGLMASRAALLLLLLGKAWGGHVRLRLNNWVLCREVGPCPWEVQATQPTGPEHRGAVARDSREWHI